MVVKVPTKVPLLKKGGILMGEYEFLIGLISNTGFPIVEVALYYTLNLNDDFVEPLEEKEVKSLVKSSVRAYYDHLEDKTKGYNYKNETLIDLLEIKEDEQAHLKTIIFKSIKYARNNERHRVVGTRSDYLEQQKEQTEDKLWLLKEALKRRPNATNKELMEYLNWSLRTVQNYKKKLNE